MEVLDIYEESKRFPQSRPDWDDLVRSFRAVCSRAFDTYIVLDAIDECDEIPDRRRILQALKTVLGPWTKLFVTCRHVSKDIRDLLLDSSAKNYSKIPIKPVTDELKGFLNHEIQSKDTYGIIDVDLKEKIISTILSNCQGS
jgi:hypothetical protein